MQRSIAIVALYDLSKRDGFTGHLSYLRNHLETRGFDVRTFGVASAPPIVPVDGALEPGYDLGAQSRAALRAIGYVKSARPALAILTQAGSLINAPLAARLAAARCPIVYDCLDPAVEFMRNAYGKSSLNAIVQPYLRFSERVLDRFAKSTWSVSPGLDALLRGRGWRGTIRRFYNVHNTAQLGTPGASALRRQPGWERACILVYAGALQPRFRGIETQLEAVARVRARGIDLRFVVLGSSGSDEPFRAHARDLEIEDFVQFLPAVAPNELADILRDCDVAVSNSLGYALPSKIFEYIRNGVRLISIDDGNDVNALCGAFVELYDGSLESLVTGLASLARRPPEPERIERADRFLTDLRAQNDHAIDEAIEEAAGGGDQADRPQRSTDLRQRLEERDDVDDQHARRSATRPEHPAVRGRIDAHVA